MSTNADDPGSEPQEARRASPTDEATTVSTNASSMSLNAITPQPPPRTLAFDLEDGVDLGGNHYESARMANGALGRALMRTSSGSGRLDDALERAAKAARDELREFAESSPPHHGDACAAFILASVLIARWPVYCIVTLCCPKRNRNGKGGGGGGFFTALVRLGGIEKVNTLLTVAQFDTGELLDEAEFEKQGEKLVSNATAGCQNTAVVATLFIATTHLGNIGRPTPWLPSEPSAAAYGPDITQALMWATLAFNVTIEVGTARQRTGHWLPNTSTISRTQVH